MSADATSTDRASLDVHQHSDHAEPEALTAFANRAREFDNVHAVDVWNHTTGTSEVVLSAERYDGLCKAAIDTDDELELEYVAALTGGRVEICVRHADN